MVREREGRGVDAQSQAKARQREHEKNAGLPRKHVEADDVPDDGTPG